ncbi:MAG TPA: hypothetical protein VGV89_09360 [Thermoplasmata archaeon]|nr:hypothetical protein [Thermoplasmata archaeon]
MVSSSEATALAIEALIVLVIARRSYSLTQGVPYSPVRLAASSVLILFIWTVSELEAFALTPWAFPYLIGIDVAILVAASLASIPVAARHTEVTRTAGGGGTVRIGFAFAAIFLVLFVARIAIEAALFPGALSFGPPPSGYPPVDQQAVVAIVDALFSLSAGLLVGRSLGIRQRWESSAVRVTADVGA